MKRPPFITENNELRWNSTDLISNTSSIVKHDPKFAAVYLQEKRELLAVMTKADRRLWEMAHQMASADRITAQAAGDL